MVEYLKFNGKQIPVRVSYYALTQYKKETGVDFQNPDTSEVAIDELAMIEPIMFYGIESGCRAIGEPMPFKREEMFEILEECFMQFSQLMPKFFPPQEKNEQALITGNRQQRRAIESK